MTDTNEKWQGIIGNIPTTLKTHFKGSTAELGSNGLIVYLPSPTANIAAIEKQIESRYIRPKVTREFGDVAINYQSSLPDMPEPKESIRVVDRRRPRHFRVDNELYDDGHAARMKPSGLSVYLCLCRHADYDTNDCYPSYQTIARKCGIGRSTVIRHCKRLAQFGYMEIEHNFNSNGDNASNTFFINELPNIESS
jgi:hypothetical protein